MDIEKQIEALVTDIQALARVATVQEAKVSRLDEAMTSLAVSMTTLAEEGRETRRMLAAYAEEGRETRRMLAELGKETDRRIQALVSAIGEFIRRGSPSRD